VGSGGWANIFEKFYKAKSYCDAPFEISREGTRKRVIPSPGEWIGDHRNGSADIDSRRVQLWSADAAQADLAPASLDAVFTDPPYFGNVQYAELMDFCYVWLRRLVGREDAAFTPASTRNPAELTGNTNMQRGLPHFAEGLSAVMRHMVTALKPGAPFAFTYHHNQLDAYFPIAVGLLDAGLICSASLPCPGEMGASIHINGTGSSTIDTVFVCRTTGQVARRQLADSVQAVADLVREDLAQLRRGGVKPTRGDTRCIIHGHLIRLGIWRLRSAWDAALPVGDRLARLADAAAALGTVEQIEDLAAWRTATPAQLSLSLAECAASYAADDWIAF
jgi:hypothetical protein